MSNPLLHLLQPNTYQEEIKKSRFVAQAVPLADPELAPSLLQQLSTVEASHNCWAWRFGQQYRFSDDGEPGGTAGRPILTAIEQQDFDQVLVVVTRWYGGIQLGTGGLARAYGGCAQQCLRLAKSAPWVPMTYWSGSCPYPVLELFKVRLKELEGRIEQEDFAATGVTLQLAVPSAAADELQALFTDLTRGAEKLQPTST